MTMNDLNDLYKEFFYKTINSGIELTPELIDIRLKIISFSYNPLHDLKLNSLQEILENRTEIGFTAEQWQNLYQEYNKYLDERHPGFERFVKIMQTLCKGRHFTFSHLTASKHTLIYWINVGGIIESNDWVHIVKYSKLSKDELLYLLNLYKSKGGKISLNEMDLIMSYVI